MRRVNSSDTLFSVRSVTSLDNNIYEERKKDWGLVVTSPCLWADHSFSFFALDIFLNYVNLMSRQQQHVYYHCLKGTDPSESAKWIGISEKKVLAIISDIRDNSYGYMIGLAKETDIKVYCDGQFISQMISPSCPDIYKDHDLIVVKIMKEFVSRAMGSYWSKACSRFVTAGISYELLFKTIEMYDQFDAVCPLSFV